MPAGLTTASAAAVSPGNAWAVSVAGDTPGAGELHAPAFGLLLNVCTIPPQTVPDLGGDTTTRARQQLAAVGLTLGSVTTVIQCDQLAG